MDARYYLHSIKLSERPDLCGSAQQNSDPDQAGGVKVEVEGCSQGQQSHVPVLLNLEWSPGVPPKLHGISGLGRSPGVSD